MKKLIFTLLFALCGISAWAQAPQKLAYQILVLDPKTGSVLKAKNVDVKLEIRQGMADGMVVYNLQKNVTTGVNGTCLLTLEPPTTINWSKGPFFLATYVGDKLVACTQILSVAFALQADKAVVADSSAKAAKASLADCASTAKVADYFKSYPTKELLVGEWQGKWLIGGTEDWTFRADGTAHRIGSFSGDFTWVLIGNCLLCTNAYINVRSAYMTAVDDTGQLVLIDMNEGAFIYMKKIK